MENPSPERLVDFIADLRQLIDAFEAAPVLKDLQLSPAGGRVGELLTIAIRNATDGSSLAVTAPDGMTLNSAARTMTGRPTQAGAFNVLLSETLVGARNSPRGTTVAITIQPAAAGPDRVTFGNATVRMGDRRVRMNGASTTTPDPTPRAFFSAPFFADPFFSS